MTVKGTLASAAKGSGTAAGTRPVAGGACVDGLRHGMWRIAHPDGSVEGGCNVAGLLHGAWVLRDPGRQDHCPRALVSRQVDWHRTVDDEDGPCGVLPFETCGSAEP